MSVIHSSASSPLGTLRLSASNIGLVALGLPYESDEAFSCRSERCSNQADSIAKEILVAVTEQLSLYFEGCLKSFNVPIDVIGTAFQLAVWRELISIPYGKTSSYKSLAGLIDKPKACRAVGMANSRNPIPIIIPCHRVIGSNNRLVGYSGGLDTKRWLLAHERAVLSEC